MTTVKRITRWFSSDGINNCTLFPEGNWSECCARHDRRYANTRLTKYQADKLMFRCVKKKSNVLVASIIYLGVTLFGDEYYKEAQRENM